MMMRNLLLILDYNAVRRQEETKCPATELGIRLLFIPLGLTDELQTLNRFVPGVMNTNCRRCGRTGCGERADRNGMSGAGMGSS
jgi:hypothetical protein